MIEMSELKESGRNEGYWQNWEFISVLYVKFQKNSDYIGSVTQIIWYIISYMSDTPPGKPLVYLYVTGYLSRARLLTSVFGFRNIPQL